MSDPKAMRHDDLITDARDRAARHRAEGLPVTAAVLTELCDRLEMLVKVERERYASAARAFGVVPPCDRGFPPPGDF